MLGLKVKKLLSLFLVAITLSACGDNAYTPTDLTPDDPGPKPSASEFQQAAAKELLTRLGNPGSTFGPISQAGGRWTMCSQIESGEYSGYLAQFWWDDGRYISGVVPVAGLIASCDTSPFL